MISSIKKRKFAAKTAPLPALSRGFSLVELMVTMTIFGILMTGIFQAYIAQMKNTTREYGIAESDIDRQIGLGLLSRDMNMTGYGLADDYNGLSFAPRAVAATNGSGAAGDTLTLMGTALGLQARQAQHWSYVESIPSGNYVRLKTWTDASGNLDQRENIEHNDRVILIEPSSKKLLTDTSTPPNWLFKFDQGGPSDTNPDNNQIVSWIPTKGVVAYGLYKDGETVATQPFYAVRYYLSTINSGEPDHGLCAPGLFKLLRAESRTTAAPDSGDNIIPCVADFQVAFGLDTNSDRRIDTWDNGGVTTAGYDVPRLNRSVKEVRVYALVQIGKKDLLYTYPSATVQVGDAGIGTGRTFTFSSAQRNYRWRVMQLVTSPRNLR